MLPIRTNTRTPHRGRGFTLTELLVAVAILIVVIIATARIFGTVSKVTGAGQANADMLQTAQTIEKQIRADIARISSEGFLAIQGVEVLNDVNGAPLLNSSLPANATLRCDRLTFLAEGQQDSTAFAGSDDKISTVNAGTYWPNKQSMVQRIYYGHGVQLRNAKPGFDGFLGGMENGLPLLPWTFDPPGASDGGITTVNWSTGQTGSVVLGTQPSAREWTLARQAMLLADDGTGGFLRFNNRDLDPKNSTISIWNTTSSPSGANYDSGPFSSRVDIAASTIDKIRQTVTNFGGASWANQRTQILGSLGIPGTSVPLRYPRAERIPPSGSTDRIDQMLTNPTMAAGCSSFIVEWTWGDGVGRQSNPDGSTVDPTPAAVSSGDEWVGYVVNDDVANGKGEQPWFGMPDNSRGVYPLSTVPLYTGSCGGANAIACLGLPIYPSNIEGNGVFVLASPLSGVRVYEAVFGFNQTRPLFLNQAANTNLPDPSVGFTPWPTALRFTFTLHDPQQRFPEGRTFQFVVELPRR